MSACIRSVDDWLKDHPKTKQWIWFVTLWCGGLFTVLLFSYPIKWLLRILA